MWYDIKTQLDIDVFTNRFFSLHDSCIKEIKYYSGAYVDENYAMYPVNSKGILNVIIQRQYEIDSVIELEFSGLEYINLYTNQNFSCEILESKFILKDDNIYWIDDANVNFDEFNDYKRTLVCAKKLKWRVLNIPMGNRKLYMLK